MAQILTTVTNDQLPESYKTPPHSVEAEQAVLGGLMLDNHAWDKVADVINEEDFYRLDHRLIYRHICKLIEHNKPADVVTVAESLETSAELQNAGGLTYVGMMAQNTPSAANIRRPLCFTLRNQEIPCITVFYINYITKLAEADNLLHQNNLHTVAPQCKSV